MRGKHSVPDQGELCQLRTLMKNLETEEIKVEEIIAARTKKAGLRKAASLIGMEKENICIAWRSVRTKQGEKFSALNLNFSFNPDFVDVLKDTEEARFCKMEKIWHIPQDKFLEYVAEEMSEDYFSSIIDLDDGVLGKTGVAVSKVSEKLYDLLPAPITVRVAELCEAMEEGRPGDDFRHQYLRAFDGVKFEKFPGDSFQTRHPILLLRAQVSNGKPRYAMVSSITYAISDVFFETKAMATLSIFHDTFGVLQEPVFIA